MKASFKALWIPLGLIAAFAVGFFGGRVGRDDSHGGERAELFPKATAVRGGGEGANSFATRWDAPFSAATWPAVKKDLQARWGASPAFEVDFELREETWCQLESVPLAELEALLREMPSRYSYIGTGLRSQVLAMLVLRGGGDFVRSLVADPPKNGFQDLGDAMNAWFTHDPLTALEWLDGEGRKDVEESLGESFRLRALSELSWKNPEEFEKHLAGLDADSKAMVLSWVAAGASYDPERRRQILERAEQSSPDEAWDLRRGLLRSEAAQDPKAAFETLKGMNVPDADRGALDLAVTDFLLAEASFKRVVERGNVITDWMARNPEQEIPEVLQERMGQWANSGVRVVSGWLEGQPSGKRRDELAHGAVMFFGTRESMFALEEIAGVAEMIGDDGMRAEAYRSIQEKWRARDPDKAGIWESGLSEKDRQALGDE